MKSRYIVFIGILHLLSFNCVAGDWAKEILAESGVKGGLIVHVGCGDGRLTLDLRANDSFLVHGLETDAGKVERAREFIRLRGLYGPVSVSVLRGSRLPYADNLVNLVVSENLGGVDMEEVMRVLAPRGVALIKRNGKWVKTVKPWPEDIDDWTHWLYDASGNAVSRDTVAGPPRHLQWTARPLWARLHDAPSSTSAMVSANGRIFYISDEGPTATYENVADKWFLVARDGFNGVLLWKRPLGDWGWKQWTANWHARNNQPFQMPKRLVAIGDRVFATLGFNSPLTELDAATGEIVRTFRGTEYTDEILFHDGLLVLGLNDARHDPAAVFPEPIRKSIAVLDADSGRVLFRRSDYTGLNAKTDSMAPVGRLELAVGDGRIFIADHNDVVAVSLDSGEELWRRPRLDGPRQKANFNTWMGDLCTLVYNNGVVLFAQPEGTLGFHSCPGTLYAFDATDGRLMWQSPYGGWVHNTQPNVFVIDGLVWIHEYQETEMKGKAPLDSGALDYAVVGLDLRTGREKRRCDTREIFDVAHHHRCYRNKATERFLLTSRRGVEFTEIASSEIALNHWTRGDCHIGVMPSNGMLYTTPHPCSCHIDTKLNGYFCLAPEQGADRRRTSRQPLLKGPAYGRIVNSKSKIENSKAWPTFRANAMRSGSVKSSVGSDLKEKWKTNLRGIIGPATVAGGKVFVPVIDEHRVVALDAATGDIEWSFTAGARIDTPPTIYKGMALFGSADGWAYCVRSADGQLVWARRIAPDDRLIGKDGQLESAWPVHGSILISESGSKSGGAAAYMTAGRSSYLDGGIYFYALKPETGEVIDRRVEYSPDPETGKMPDGDAFVIPGMLADILVGDGSTVWMRRQVVFGESRQGQTHIFATGGFRDDSWFNRTTWSAGDVDRARLLVFDDSLAYGIEAYAGRGRGVPFTPGTKGYSLFAKSLKAPKVAKRSAQKGKGTGSGKGQGKETVEGPGWSTFISVRGMAMALAGEVLFVAGAPDTVDPADWLGAFEGRKGAVLMAVSAKDGGTLAEYELEKPPVFDGLVAAGGRLYVSTIDGNVVCFDGE